MIAIEKLLKKNPILRQTLVYLLHTTNDIARVFIQPNNNIDINKLITPLEDQLQEKKICVIGNSPILIGKGLGEEIDQHDIVIRCNL